MPFAGRLEVLRLKQRLDETFQRVDAIAAANLELRSDFARYLCVLVAGYVEQAVQELAIEWCRKQAGPSVVRYATVRLKGLQNVNGERLRQTLGAFSAEWRDSVEKDYADEINALDSVYRNRNLIAHGANVGVSIVQMVDYYEQVQRIVDFMIECMDPA